MIKHEYVIASMSNIYALIIINKSGGLIYHHEEKSTQHESTIMCEYPLAYTLKERDDKYEVVFGESDNVKVGFVISQINGQAVTSRSKINGDPLMDFLNNRQNYPLSITFLKPRPSVNEKIMIASMFHSMHAISIQLSPAKNSSGITMLQSESFRLCCHHSITGLKFILLASPDCDLDYVDIFRQFYEIYADYALKNPFYTLEMPIRSESFDSAIATLISRN